MGILQVIMVAALVLSGIGVAILGTIKLELARRLQIDEAKIGGLISLFGFTMMPIILAAGFLTDLLDPEELMAGRRVGLIAGSIVFSISLFALAAASKYGYALLGVLLLSAGWSLLVNVGNVLTPAAFPGASSTFSTNLANVFFGLGAFSTPLLIGYLMRTFSMKRALLFVGCVALFPGVLSLLTDFTTLLRAGSDTPVARGSTRLLDDPMLWILGLALFFYGPLEASMGGWTTTYLAEKGFTERRAANLLSVFWLAFMSARLVTAFAIATFPVLRGMEAIQVLALAVTSVLVLGVVVLGKSSGTAAVAVILAGLVFGPIFPTLMGLLLDHFHPSVQGRAVGIFFAIGGIGWTVIPMLIGAYARRTSVQHGFRIAVAAALGLCGIAVVLNYYQSP